VTPNRPADSDSE